MQPKPTYRFRTSTILALTLLTALIAWWPGGIPNPPPAHAATTHTGIATFYGPGYYYHHFACPGAGTYQPHTRGVAVNTTFAPCGAAYTLTYHHHTIRVHVVDRCPGCDTSYHPFDLTAQSLHDLCHCIRPYTLHGVSYHRS